MSPNVAASVSEQQRRPWVHRRAIRRLPLHAAAFLLCLAVHAGEPKDPETPVRIEPSVEVVPANHLKFYLHFPEPMERGNVFRYLRLVEIDKEGKEVAEVPEPFREVELWDETFTRMTLWFHPGRQKPGVNLNVEIGPILEEGKRFRLEVSEEWKTESSEFLGSDSSHTFFAGPEDVSQPEPREWQIFEVTNWPCFGVDTSEVLDPQSVAKRVRVFVDGKPETILQRGSILLIGKPRVGWTSGRLVIDPRLEDLAGNSVARPFNVDLSDKANLDSEEPREIEIEFERPRSFRSFPATP